LPTNLPVTNADEQRLQEAAERFELMTYNSASSLVKINNLLIFISIAIYLILLILCLVILKTHGFFLHYFDDVHSFVVESHITLFKH
jgi:hypothetical protein